MPEVDWLAAGVIKREAGAVLIISVVDPDSVGYF
jgi:hypothetical protein